LEFLCFEIPHVGVFWSKNAIFKFENITSLKFLAQKCQTSKIFSTKMLQFQNFYTKNRKIPKLSNLKTTHFAYSLPKNSQLQTTTNSNITSPTPEIKQIPHFTLIF
jgi:hypothetical protein